jgi:hypothetical protein
MLYFDINIDSEYYLQNSLIVLFLVFIYDVFLKNIVHLYFINNKMNILNKINILPVYVNQSEYFEKIEYELNHVVIDIKDECTCQIFYIDEDELKHCNACKAL